MTLRLADNEWGFSIAENNPFRIFRVLQEVARKSVGEDKGCKRRRRRGIFDLEREECVYDINY